MAKKKEKKIDLNNLTPEEQLKLEIAEEIGVFDKVMEGRIGGLITKKKKQLKEESMKSLSM